VIDEGSYRTRLAALRQEEAAMVLPVQYTALITPSRRLPDKGDRLTSTALNKMRHLLIDTA